MLVWQEVNLISPSERAPLDRHTLYSSAGLGHCGQGAGWPSLRSCWLDLIFHHSGVLTCIKIFMDEMVGTHSGPSFSLNTKAVRGQITLVLPEFTWTHH